MGRAARHLRPARDDAHLQSAGAGGLRRARLRRKPGHCPGGGHEADRRSPGRAAAEPDAVLQVPGPAVAYSDLRPGPPSRYRAADLRPPGRARRGRATARVQRTGQGDRRLREELRAGEHPREPDRGGHGRGGPGARADLVETAGVGAVFLELPLAQPAAAHVCEAAEADGFFFSGIGPRFAADGDVLRLQYLAEPLDTARRASPEPLWQGAARLRRRRTRAGRGRRCPTRRTGLSSARRGSDLAHRPNDLALLPMARAYVRELAALAALPPEDAGAPDRGRRRGLHRRDRARLRPRRGGADHAERRAGPRTVTLGIASGECR